ncbi:MAG: transporter substrate-binding domain-containing protein, partial [Thiohalomonadales bacterium]|nr:transporter substrate-binding domain-containing protein [Thiohalomonadales bacterium]
VDAHPVIRVAADPDYAPFQFKNDAGQSVGVANDYLALISKRLGVRFEYRQPDSWAQALQMIKNHEADMVAVATETPERLAYMRFTAPYVDFPDVIITRSGEKVSSLEELHGKHLLTIKGFGINEFLREHHPEIELRMAEDVQTLLGRVSTGEADAGVLNLATTSYAIGKWKITNLHISSLTDFSYKLALASRRDWPMLNHLLSKALATITEEERQQVFRKWITITAPASEKKVKRIQLTPKEREWLDEHPVILAASDPDWPPVDYLDRDKKFTGMAADYIELVSQRLGIRIEVLPHATWSQSLESARERKVALLTAAASTPDRDKFLSFTKPYLELPASIIINDATRGISDLADLRGKRVAVVKNYASHDFLERMHPELELLPVADISSGLYAVSYGEVDAFIANVATASYYIEKLAIQNLRVAGESGFIYKIGIASRSDWPILHRLLEKSVASISREERQAIYRKWVGLKPEVWKPTREQLVALVITLIFISFGVILIWNRQLRKTVESRTRELRASEDEARTARETAEKANSAKSDFLAAASHDLRQPLHAMSLQIGQLNELLQDDKAQQVLAQISSSQFALSDILNALLDISHLDAGTLKPNFSHFPLAQLFTRLENEFTPQARERGIELRLHPTRAWLYSDATLLYRILANLVDNAVKHTRAPGVLIGARKRGNDWCIQVWDCGPGIPADQQQTIFDEFIQLNNPGRERRKGLGLGLSIVRRLNQLLGHQLRLVSRLGFGTCFTLQVTQGTQILKQTSEPLSHEERGYRLQGAVVLVVDDDPDVLAATRNLLTSWKCAVLTAASLEDAITVAADEDIDVIVADYHLGDGHSGLDVIRTLNEKRGEQSKALIITGHVNPEELSRLRNGQYPVLSKPVAPVMLRSALHNLMAD